MSEKFNSFGAIPVESIIQKKDIAKEKENGELKKINIPSIGEIEYAEKIIKFPERVVHETSGVEGYTRKAVSWEEISRVFGIDIDEFEKIRKNGILVPSNKKESGEYASQKSIDIFIEKTKTMEAIVSALTEGAFIDQTLNHMVYGESDMIDNVKLKDLTRDRLLEKINSTGREDAYDIKTNNYISIPELSKRTGLSEEDLFSREAFEFENIYFQSNYGLNVEYPGKLWRGSINLTDVILGFKLNSNNYALRRYCEKIKDLREKQDIKYSKEREGYGSYEQSREASVTLNMILEPIMYYKDDDFDFAGSSEKLKESNEVAILGIIGDSHDTGHHPRIPIIKNHPKIPDLRWCYADYAFVPTKNGINIIKTVAPPSNEDVATIERVRSEFKIGNEVRVMQNQEYSELEEGFDMVIKEIDQHGNVKVLSASTPGLGGYISCKDVEKVLHKINQP